MPLKFRKYVQEPHIYFWPGIFNIGTSCYIDGYWQSEKYFSDIRNTIFSDFSLKKELVSARFIKIAKKMKGSNSISIHVRRGDFVMVKKTNKAHGVCPLDYYEIAIKYISEKICNPEFFFFSDDIEWVKKNLSTGFKENHISGEGLSDAEEMMLMSTCRHNIIANSTFSWWGAWLNSNPGKIVVSPSKFLLGSSTDNKDLIPENWHKLNIK